MGSKSTSTGGECRFTVPGSRSGECSEAALTAVWCCSVAVAIPRLQNICAQQRRAADARSGARLLLARLTPNFEVQALVRKYNNVVTEIQITMSAIKP